MIIQLHTICSCHGISKNRSGMQLARSSHLVLVTPNLFAFPNKKFCRLVHLTPAPWQLGEDKLVGQVSEKEELVFQEPKSLCWIFFFSARGWVKKTRLSWKWILQACFGCCFEESLSQQQYILYTYVCVTLEVFTMSNRCWIQYAPRARQLWAILDSNEKKRAFSKEKNRTTRNLIRKYINRYAQKKILTGSN